MTGFLLWFVPMLFNFVMISYLLSLKPDRFTRIGVFAAYFAAILPGINFIAGFIWAFVWTFVTDEGLAMIDWFAQPWGPPPDKKN